MNPIHKEKNKWYFWDETWSDKFGPYNTKKEAQAMLEKYAEYLNLESALIQSCKFIVNILGDCPLSHCDSIMTTGKNYGLTCLIEGENCENNISDCWRKWFIYQN
ncbi:MAG: hypothetical protein ACXACR_17070 [Candidatus Hodarchaeales archaeon]|jgi:hypothetical protein